MSSLEERIDTLARELAEEIRVMEAQLAKSAAARRATAAALPVSNGKASHTTSEDVSAPQPLSKPSFPVDTPALSSPSSPPMAAGNERISATLSTSPSPTARDAAAPLSSAVAPVTSTHKEGTLLHLVRTGGLFGAGGSHVFVPHYVVVSGSSGISWYSSHAEYQHQPQRPLGHAAFWIETYNSRGSRFKRAAVCWPLILPEDCPAATDPSKTYFAVDYYTSGGGREQLVLAAGSSEERDAWVQLLTKYIDLYLAPRAESEELQHITRGAAVPMHRSGVIEGEAPGGTIL